jgi:inner membrane transporter RhtA
MTAARSKTSRGAMPFVHVLLSIVSVQLGASYAKTLFPLIGPLPTALLRISLATAVLLPVWRPWRARLDRRAAAAILLYGVCLGIMNMTFYLALTRVPLGVCVALEFLGPLSVALLASRRRLDFVWAALAAVGVLLILPLRAEQAPLDGWGVLLALVAGACWAFYIVFGKKAGALVHGGVATSLGMAVATLIALPFGLSAARLGAVTPRVLAVAFGVAVFSSAVPYSLEMFALETMPARTFGILMSLEPAVAALFGLAILKERLDASRWAAIACVIVASAGSSATAREALPADPALELLKD